MTDRLAAELVIHSPFDAAVSVLVLDEHADMQASVDGHNVNVQPVSTGIDRCHIIALSPSGAEPADSADYEYRLSAR